MIFHVRQAAIRSYRHQIDGAASETDAHAAIVAALRFVDIGKPEGQHPDGLRRYRVRTRRAAGKLSRGYLVIDATGSVWSVQPATCARRTRC